MWDPPAGDPAREPVGDPAGEVRKALRDPNWKVRYRAVKGIVGARGPGILEVLVAAAADPEAAVRIVAAKALSHFSGGTAMQALVGLMSDPDPGVREAASEAASGTGGVSVDDLLRVLRGGREEAYAPAIKALGEAREGRAAGAIARFLDYPDSLVANESARALGKIGNAEALDALARAVGGQASPGVREAAAEALGWIPDPKAVDALVGVLFDEVAEAHGLNLRAPETGLPPFNHAVLKSLWMLVPKFKGMSREEVYFAYRREKEERAALERQRLAEETRRKMEEQRRALEQEMLANRQGTVSSSGVARSAAPEVAVGVDRERFEGRVKLLLDLVQGRSQFTMTEAQDLTGMSRDELLRNLMGLIQEKFISGDFNSNTGRVDVYRVLDRLRQMDPREVAGVLSRVRTAVGSPPPGVVPDVSGFGWNGKELVLPEARHIEPPANPNLCITCQQRRGKVKCAWCGHLVCKKCEMRLYKPRSTASKVLQFAVGVRVEKYFSFCGECYRVGKRYGFF
ncbi:MAG: HEAT repeat domain-containing protein [Promethearchaeota archaeon]